MKQKIYAVRSGHQIGIFENWTECQKATAGFSGAQFKSFKTRAEAEAYIATAKNDEEKPVTLKGDPAKNPVMAYVDGSYAHSQKRYAGGAVLLWEDQEVNLCRADSKPSLVDMRNVSGELLGTELALEWFEAQRETIGADRLIIHHDYEGIAKWATGEWKTTKEGTRAYVSMFKQYNAKFPVDFVKVLAHSGDTFNEKADMLAKRALGLESEGERKGEEQKTDCTPCQ